MSDLLSEEGFTDYLVAQLKPMEIPIKVPEPLLVELDYGTGEPVLSIALSRVYEAYTSDPEQLDALLAPYLVEIGWTAQAPRYPAREILEKTMPVMKDILIEPVAQDGESVQLGDKEIVLRLPKGPVLLQDLVKRPEEHLVVQFMMEEGENLLELSRGDVLTCFPEPTQIAGIATQNLAKRAVKSGLTTRGYNVENFQTQMLLIGFRDESLSNYVASLVNIADVMVLLEKNLEAESGITVVIPTRDQMLVSSHTEELAICEMGLLANYLKKESDKPVSSLVWRFKDGEVIGLQTVKLEDEP
jgi:hypothetical protein